MSKTLDIVSKEVIFKKNFIKNSLCFKNCELKLLPLSRIDEDQDDEQAANLSKILNRSLKIDSCGKKILSTKFLK